MTRSADFGSVVRGGTRVRTTNVVLHHRSGASSDPTPDAAGAALVGLVVSRSVGGSVVRHRVSRRLRAQLAARLEHLQTGSATVVRALPAAAHASSQQLGADLDRALERVSRR